MSWFMVDVETDGPIPGTDDYSMVQIGVVKVTDPLDRNLTFFGQLSPISDYYDPEALKVTGLTRDQTLRFDNPNDVMRNLDFWIKANNVGKRPMFISDNNGFDWMFCCYYFHRFLNYNPFGHSSTNLGSLYKGMAASVFKTFKHLRQTKHTHNPVDDAMGNAEALIEMKRMGLKIDLE